MTHEREIPENRLRPSYFLTLITQQMDRSICIYMAFWLYCKPRAQGKNGEHIFIASEAYEFIGRLLVGCMWTYRKFERCSEPQQEEGMLLGYKSGMEIDRGREWKGEGVRV